MTDTLIEGKGGVEPDIEEIVAKFGKLSLSPAPTPSIVKASLCCFI